MPNARALFAVAILTAAGFIAPPRAVAQGTPGDVVTAFYMACNEGLYSKAEKLVTPESIEKLKASMGLMGTVQQYCDQLSEEGTIVRIELLSTKQRGEGATVEFRFHYKGGKTDDGKEVLVLKGGVWKLQLFGQNG